MSLQVSGKTEANHGKKISVRNLIDTEQNPNQIRLKIKKTGHSRSKNLNNLTMVRRNTLTTNGLLTAKYLD